MNDTKQAPNHISSQEESIINASYSSFKIIASKGVFTFIKAERDGKFYVLKTLKEDLRDRLPLRNALKKEFKTCKNFSHVGVVRYNELVQTADYGLCIEQEYIDGRNLHSYLQEHHTDDEKVEIINQIAAALQYIHQQRAVHRNLNLLNIFVTKQGNQVKIVDFNVLSVEELKPTADVSRFIAPELKDETLAADATADIYSLGTIMKAMGLTLAYSDVIERCCAYKRSARYADITGFLADFHREKPAISMPKLNPGVVKIAAICVVILVVAALIYGLRGVIGSQISKLSSSSLFQDDIVPAKVDTAKVNKNEPKTAQTVVSETGKMAFLATMKPALYKDLDRIFAPFEGKTLDTDARKSLNRHIKVYYKGLIQANDTLDNEQRLELDKVFGYYVKQKKATLK